MKHFKIYAIYAIIIFLFPIYSVGEDYEIVSTDINGIVLVNKQLKTSISERGKNCQGTVINIIYDSPNNWDASEKRCITHAVDYGKNKSRLVILALI